MSADTPADRHSEERLTKTTTRSIHVADAGVADNRLVAVETLRKSVTVVAFVHEDARDDEITQAVEDLEDELRRLGGGR